MSNPNLHVNYFIIYHVLIVLVLMLGFAIVAKIAYDYSKHHDKTLFRRFTNEISQLLWPTSNSDTELSFAQRLDKYYKKHRYLLKRMHTWEIFEEALLEIINENDEIAIEGQIIALKFSSESQIVGYLMSSDIDLKVKGCQQVGVYRSSWALPILFKLLHFTLPELQRSVLLALADFGQPELIVDAFGIIEHAVLVSKHTMREVMHKMGDKKIELFRDILRRGSPILVPLFLEITDIDSINQCLNEIVFLLRSSNIDLKVAAIRALAQIKDEIVADELIDALQANEWEVRAAAAKALQNVSIPAARLPLLQAANDKSFWVRQNASAAVFALDSSSLV